MWGFEPQVTMESEDYHFHGKLIQTHIYIQNKQQKNGSNQLHQAQLKPYQVIHWSI